MLPSPSERELERQVDLVEILKFLINARLWISLWILLAGTLASLYLMLKPTIYEASVTVQSAKVGDEDIQSTAVLNEKIKLPGFFSLNSLKLCPDPQPSFFFNESKHLLHTQLTKNSPYLQISIRHTSPEIVKVCLEALFTEIQIHQAQLSQPVIEKNKLKRTKSIPKFCWRKNSTSFPSNNNFMPKADTRRALQTC